MIDPLLAPDFAILDAGFTKTVPPRITADTGMDVFTHAIEAFLSTAATTFSDIYAEKAIKTVIDSLPKVYKDGDRIRERNKMLEASCMAGIAFTNAGLGINHSLAHILGGKFHIPHGRLNAILLPYVLKFYVEKCNDVRIRLDELGRLLNLKDSEDLIHRIEELNKSICIEGNLKELGKIDTNLFEGALDEMGQIALVDRCTPTTPITVTKFDLINILRKAYYGF